MGACARAVHAHRGGARGKEVPMYPFITFGAASDLSDVIDRGVMMLSR